MKWVDKSETEKTVIYKMARASRRNTEMARAINEDSDQLVYF